MKKFFSIALLCALGLFAFSDTQAGEKKRVRRSSGSLWRNFKDSLWASGNNLKNSALGVKDNLVKTVSDVKDAAIDKYDDLKDGVQNKLSSASGAVSEKISDLQDGAANMITSGSEAVSGAVGGAADSVSGALSSMAGVHSSDDSGDVAGDDVSSHDMKTEEPSVPSESVALSPVVQAEMSSFSDTLGSEIEAINLEHARAAASKELDTIDSVRSELSSDTNSKEDTTTEMHAAAELEKVIADHVSSEDQDVLLDQLSSALSADAGQVASEISAVAQSVEDAVVDANRPLNVDDSVVSSIVEEAAQRAEGEMETNPVVRAASLESEVNSGSGDVSQVATDLQLLIEQHVPEDQREDLKQAVDSALDESSHGEQVKEMAAVASQVQEVLAAAENANEASVDSLSDQSAVSSDDNESNPDVVSSADDNAMTVDDSNVNSGQSNVAADDSNTAASDNVSAVSASDDTTSSDDLMQSDYDTIRLTLGSVESEMAGGASAPSDEDLKTGVYVKLEGKGYSRGEIDDMYSNYLTIRSQKTGMLGAVSPVVSDDNNSSDAVTHAVHEASGMLGAVSPVVSDDNNSSDAVSTVSETAAATHAAHEASGMLGGAVHEASNDDVSSSVAPVADEASDSADVSVAS